MCQALKMDRDCLGGELVAPKSHCEDDTLRLGRKFLSARQAKDDQAEEYRSAQVRFKVDMQRAND